MKTHYNIIIAGAGGIAQAAGLILAEWSTVTPTIYIGNRTLDKAKKVTKWIENGTTKKCEITPFHLNSAEITDEMKTIFGKGDALLDCLPGKLAPKMAGFSKDFNLCYANLTEYVAETNQIVGLAKNAKTVRIEFPTPSNRLSFIHLTGPDALDGGAAAGTGSVRTKATLLADSSVMAQRSCILLELLYILATPEIVSEIIR